MGLLNKLRRVTVADWIRHILLAWLFAATIEYLLLPGDLKSLVTMKGVGQMSFLRVLLLTGVGVITLRIISLYKNIRIIERWAIVGVFAVIAITAIFKSFTLPFLCICLLVMLILMIFALRGWNSKPVPVRKSKESHKAFFWVTVFISVCFFLFVSIWTVCRYLTFGNSTYDFGIFTQMFHSMKTTGVPVTTLEREEMISHFDVHMSPIYYLMLPIYWLFPSPVTLQVLQAAVITSAVIPLWKLAKHHGLNGFLRMLVCAILLLAPAFSGGTSYDLHENCFLTPLILWLFYGIDRKNGWITAIAALLTLMVKEDAAVYVAVIGLWVLVSSLLHRNGWGAMTGGILLTISIGYFLAVTNYLANHGDGVMSFRYYNLMISIKDGLMSVAKNILLSPMKMLYECVDPEKLEYILLTVLPLLALPLITRRYERYILLIPYILFNLISDYVYQHNIFFQYNFGSIAFLMYLTVVNLSDLSITFRQASALAAAVISGVCCITTVMPRAIKHPRNYLNYHEYYASIRDTLSVIPEGTSVTSLGWYTPHLSDRAELYDIQYCTREQLLSSEYVVLNVQADGDYEKYNGYKNLTDLLERNGFNQFAELTDTLVIYRNPDNA